MLAWEHIFIMKRELINHINKLLTKEESLTDTQAETIAYWELVAFQSKHRELWK
jgi:hypothetical protein